jgi:hypothetical protein
LPLPSSPGVGTVTVKLGDQLAAELAGGILKLLRAHPKKRRASSALGAD